MNIYLKELKDHIKPSIGWILGSVFLVVVSVMKFEALDASAMQMNDFLSVMPKPILAIMGGANFNLTTPGGFFGMIFTFILVLSAIYAVHLGCTCINKEELNHTSEFLFTKPAYRYHVLVMKMLSAFTHLMIFNGITFVVAILSLNKHENLTSPIFQCILFLISLELLFYAIGFLASSISFNYRRSNNYTQLSVMIFYFIHTVLDMFENTEMFYILTPFRYQSISALVTGSMINIIPYLLTILLSIVIITLGFIKFNKKDLAI